RIFAEQVPFDQPLAGLLVCFMVGWDVGCLPVQKSLQPNLSQDVAFGNCLIADRGDDTVERAGKSFAASGRFRALTERQTSTRHQIPRHEQGQNVWPMPTKS